MTDAIIKQLIEHEGDRLHPYVDTVGKTTIGIGRNLTDNGITQEESLYLCENDLGKVRADLDAFWPGWRSIDEIRQRVLLDMAFNLGITRFMDFHITLSQVRTGNYTAAAASMLLSKWARQVGPRAIRLAEMMRTGAEVSLEWARAELKRRG